MNVTNVKNIFRDYLQQHICVALSLYRRCEKLKVHRLVLVELDFLCLDSEVLFSLHITAELVIT